MTAQRAETSIDSTALIDSTTLIHSTAGRAALAGHRDHLNRSMSRLLSLMGAPTEWESRGCHVFDTRGEAYLSCGGYGVFLLGHAHPRVVAAVSEQLRRHPLATRHLLDPTVVAAARALVEVAPAGLQYVTFTNSGAEAVEVALKLSKVHGRHRIIAMGNGFHGKTTGALSVTGREAYRAPFGPLLDGARFIPYGDAEALERALATGEPASVLVEPLQGEGGVRLAPDGFLAAARAACDRHGALLIIDEIQTGLGRLGSMWGCEPEGVAPDILLSGKVLGGGVMPVGAAVTTAALFEPFNRDPLLHSSTFGGNPLAAAAVTATLAVITQDRLVDAARRLGDQLLSELRGVFTGPRAALLSDIRGRGLLLGLEFVHASAAMDMLAALLRRRVIVSYSLNAKHVLRLTPPALLEPSDVVWLLDAVRGAADELLTRRSYQSR